MWDLSNLKEGAVPLETNMRAKNEKLQDGDSLLRRLKQLPPRNSDRVWVFVCVQLYKCIFTFVGIFIVFQSLSESFNLYYRVLCELCFWNTVLKKSFVKLVVPINKIISNKGIAISVSVDYF